MRSSSAVILAVFVLWRTVAVMPDGRIAGTANDSEAYRAGLRVNDFIEYIERRRFQLDRLTDEAKFLIVNRAGSRIVILNPFTPPSRGREN